MALIRKHIAVYAESTFKKNPGITAWASLMKYKSHTATASGFNATSTNKRGELLSVISALEKIKEPCDVTIYTSSGYAYRGINDLMITWERNNWTRSKGRPLANVDLWKKLYTLCQKHTVKVMLLRDKTANKHTMSVISMAKATLKEAIATIKKKMSLALDVLRS